MTVKLGTLPFAASLSVRRIIDTEDVLDILCNIRFAGFDKGLVGDVGSTVGAGKQVVIGKLVLTGDPLGHPQIVATALATVRDHLKIAKLNTITHARPTSA
jgi:hypothetical protein